MGISITRALTEIKNLDERINTIIASSVFCVVTKGQGDRMTVPGTSKSAAQIEVDIKATYQKINDLITRRKLLKDLVQVSNSNTFVTINGTSMTVQQAIERKASVQYEKKLFERLRSQYTVNVSSAERSNTKLDEQIEAAVTTAYGNDKGKITPEQYAAVAAPRRTEHECSLLDPLKIADMLSTMADEINGFETEVDFVLAESNARTEINM